MHTTTTIRFGAALVALVAMSAVIMTTWLVRRADATGPGELFVDADAPACTDVPAEGAGDTSTPFCTITAAIDFLESASGMGGKLTLRAATYDEGTITTNHGNFSIAGDPGVARDAIVIRPTGVHDIGLHVTDPLGTCDNITIEHVTFDGTGNHNNDQGILVDDTCEPVTIRDVEVHDWAKQGILFDDSSGDEGATDSDGTQIIEADVHDNGNAGIELNDGAGNLVDGGTIFDNGSTGLRANRQSDLTVRDVAVEGNGLYGVHDFEGVDTTIDSSVVSGNADSGVLLTGPYSSADITDNTISNNGVMGIESVPGLFGTGGSNTTIRGNQLLNNDGDGISISDHDTLTVEDNQVLGNGGTGVLLDNGSDATVTGNDINGNGDSGVLADDQTNFKLWVNTIDENGAHGVNVARGDSSSVAGNEIDGNDGSGVLVADADGLLVTDNEINENGNRGVEVNDTSNTTIDGNSIDGNGAYGVSAQRNLALHLTGNTASENSATGIRIMDNTNSTVVANEIADNWTQGSSPDYGISIVAETTLLVSKNTLTRNTDAQILVDSSSDVSIVKNDFEASVDGIILVKQQAHLFQNVVIGGSAENHNRFRGLDPLSNPCDVRADACYVQIPQLIPGVPTINASYNDWGTTNPGEIEDLVCHNNEGDCALTALDLSHPVQPGDPPTTKTETPVGDVSCDGVVNSIDAALILQYTAGLTGSLPCSGNADVNGDGHVSSIDAALILQYTAGLLPNLPP